MWFRDEPSGSWWTCNSLGWRGRGVVRFLTASRQNWITSKWEGSWSRAGMSLHGWRKTYKNCLVLLISTRCIFFSVVHTRRTPQLSVLNLEQFWDGDLLGSFQKVCEWEQNTLERLVLVCGISRQYLKSSGILPVVSKQVSSNTMWFGDEPSGSWWACNTRGWRGRGVVVGAQCMIMSGSWQLLGKPNHIRMRGGSWDRACMGLHGWRKTYKNCLVLPISTRCIFFSVAQTIKTPQLSVLDMKQFWDGWTSEKFPKKCASEYKTRWKVSCWFVGSVDNI